MVSCDCDLWSEGKRFPRDCTTVNMSCNSSTSSSDVSQIAGGQGLHDVVMTRKLRVHDPPQVLAVRPDESIEDYSVWELLCYLTDDGWTGVELPPKSRLSSIAAFSASAEEPTKEWYIRSLRLDCQIVWRELEPLSLQANQSHSARGVPSSHL